MLCMECGAEMRLVQVAKANTISVSGFEHRTWQCSGCSAVEQRMTFIREKMPAQTEPIELTRTGSVQPIQTALTGKVQAEPTDPPQADRIASPESVSVQLAQTAPTEVVQTRPAGPAQTDRAKTTTTVPVKSTQTATVEPPQIRRTHQEPPGAAPQMNARAKALEEKVRKFRERVAAARTVAGPISAHEPTPSPAPPTSGEEPTLSPAPISADGPISPVGYTPALTNARITLGGLVRAIAPKGFSKVR
jgi:hypothetical protein